MPEATLSCPNCDSRLRVDYVVTVKPTTHAVKPECHRCLDAEAVESVIKHVLLNKPERHVRIITVEDA